MPLSPEDLDQINNSNSGTSYLDSETSSILLSGGLVAMYLASWDTSEHKR